MCWGNVYTDKGAYRLIEDFDDDGDGVLNKNEFVNFMASLQRDAGHSHNLFLGNVLS